MEYSTSNRHDFGTTITCEKIHVKPVAKKIGYTHLLHNVDYYTWNNHHLIDMFLSTTITRGNIHVKPVAKKTSYKHILHIVGHVYYTYKRRYRIDWFLNDYYTWNKQHLKDRILSTTFTRGKIHMKPVAKKIRSTPSFSRVWSRLFYE